MDSTQYSLDFSFPADEFLISSCFNIIKARLAAYMDSGYYDPCSKVDAQDWLWDQVHTMFRFDGLPELNEEEYELCMDRVEVFIESVSSRFAIKENSI